MHDPETLDAVAELLCRVVVNAQSDEDVAAALYMLELTPPELEYIKNRLSNLHSPLLRLINSPAE
jgi:hypothetical protein